MTALLPALVTVCSILAVPAAERLRIHVNGNDVTGARHLVLKDVTVRFDEHGNVHIDAPGYEVKVTRPDPGDAATPAVPGAGPPVAETPPARRYFVALEGQDASLLGCQIDILLGDKKLATLTGLEAQPFVDVTAAVSPGRHRLIYKVRRPPERQPDDSETPAKRMRKAYFQVRLGPGRIDAGKAVLERSLGAVRCTDRSPGFDERAFNVVID